MLQDWLLPITLLPAVGLIIMSTTNLLNSLIGEINLFMRDRKAAFKPIIKRKISQLRLLSLSLFFQYGSCATFAISGLMGGFEMADGSRLPMGTTVLIISGISGIVVALFLLIIFAFRAVGIKQKQFEILLES